MGVKKYIKRLIKYVLHESKENKVFVRPVVLNDLDSKNKVVVVTGGSSGIGYEIAKKFANNGAKVIITGRNKNKLEEAIKYSDNIQYYVSDVSEVDKHDDFIEFIDKKYGKVDILVNNAGISAHEKNYMDVSIDGFDSQFGINLRGPYFLTQKIIKKYKKDMNIIFITSERGDQCDYLPYGLTKVAINSLVRALSCNYYKKNIRVNGIAPGVTATDMFNVDKDGDMFSDTYVSGRFFRPEEVAEVVYFITSDRAKCVSGEIIHCNAGNHINKYI